MRREIEPFDANTIAAELASLPTKDRAKLAALIEFYEDSGTGNPYPARIDAYGNGLFRLRHVKSAYQGRSLFYISESREGYQKLTLLAIFKKESGKVPTNTLATARSRMEQHKGRKG